MKGSLKQIDERELFFYWTRHNPEKYNNIAIMKGKQKLAAFRDYNAPLSDFELFDLAMDPAESVNLIREKMPDGILLKKKMDTMLDELIMSVNLVNPPYIIIGSEAENPVILNRNDAAGQRGIWDQEEVYGLWKTKISEGKYRIKINFIKPVPGEGVMMIETGTIVNRAFVGGKDVTAFEMDDVALREFTGDFIPFYEIKGKRIFPFSVELLRLK